MFLPFFALHIFLFISAIVTSIRLFLFGGCHLRVGSLGTLGSNNLMAASDSLNFSVILSASLFMDLIFFLLNPALVLLDALVILSSKASIWDFRLPISASRLTNFLASLESLFHLRLSCLLVRGVSNSGCLDSLCGSLCGFQVAPLGAPWRETSVEVSVVSVHYSGEKILTQLFSTENNFSIYAL